MPEAAEKEATYEDLYSVPNNMTGEIINGQLIVTPRPSRKHTSAASSLGYKIGPPYQFGERGGPGGWVIIIEPEIGLGSNILVPDLAGWKRERFPVEETHNWISAAPDWVCEILSPGTAKTDKTEKMPIYGRHGVSHLWLFDSLAQTLDVYRLESGNWIVAGLYAQNDKVRAEPFTGIEIDLADVWLE